VPADEEVTDPPTAELPADTPLAEEPAATPLAEEPAESPLAEEPASTPPTEEATATPAAEEATDTPPTAELLVTPTAKQPADAPLAEEAEEPLDAPLAEEPAGTPPGEPLAGTEAVEEPARARVARRPTFGQTVVMVTGVLLFIWGFLPWYSDAGGSANAWSTVTIPGLLLTATWVPLLSLAIVVFVAIKVFADGFPNKILGFSWAQLSIMVGLFDALITLGFLVANRRLGDLGSLDIGVGLILSFITSLVMLAGAIADHLGMGGEEILTRLRPPAANDPRDRR
jgi:hypothetical protein